MRSFAEYRKRALESKIYTVSVRESVDCFIESLRINLLDKIKLPELIFEGNFLLNTTYNRSIKEDYEQNKFYIESVLRHYKSNLYSAIIEEAAAAMPAATASPNPLQTFENELIAKVEQMVDKLKTDVQTILNGGRVGQEDGEENPEDGGGAVVTSQNPLAGNSSSSNPASGNTGTSAGSSSSPTGPSPAGNHSAGSTHSGFSNPAHAPSSGTTGTNNVSPTHVHHHFGNPGAGGGFGPAAHGNFTPSDGIWNGIKRLGGALVPRKVRQIWHNDENRPKGLWMSKEHSEQIQTLFVENTDMIMGIIDQFRLELISYVKDRLKVIAATAGSGNPLAGNVSSNNPVAGNSASSGSGNVLPINQDDGDGGGGDNPLKGTGSSQPEAGTDPNLVSFGGPSTSAEKAADAGNEEAQKKVNEAHANISAACKALGLTFLESEKWGARSAKGRNVSRSQFKFNDEGHDATINGKPVEEVLSDAKFVKFLIHKVHELLIGPLSDNQKNQSKVSGRARKAVMDRLQLKETGNNTRAMKELLLSYGAFIRTGNIANTASSQSESEPEVSNAVVQPGGLDNPIPNNPAVNQPTIDKPAGSRLTNPRDNQANTLPINTPDEGGSNEDIPSDPAKFAEKLRNEHPEQWETLKNYHKNTDGSPKTDNQFTTLIHRIIAKGANPKVVWDKMLNLKPNNAEIAPKAPQLFQPSGQELDRGTEQPNAVGSEVAPNRGEELKEKARDELTQSLRGEDPELLKTFLKILDQTSTQELEQVVGDKVGDEATEAIIHHLLSSPEMSGNGESPTDDQQINPEGEFEGEFEEPDFKDGFEPEDEKKNNNVELNPDNLKDIFNNPEMIDDLKKFLASADIDQNKKDQQMNLFRMIDPDIDKKLAGDTTETTPERLTSPMQPKPTDGSQLPVEKPAERLKSPMQSQPEVQESPQKQELLNSDDYWNKMSEFEKLIGGGLSSPEMVKKTVSDLEDEIQAMCQNGIDVQSALGELQNRINKVRSLMDGEDSGLEDKPTIEPQLEDEPDEVIPPPRKRGAKKKAAEVEKPVEPKAAKTDKAPKIKQTAPKKKKTAAQLAKMSPEELERYAQEMYGVDKSEDDFGGDSDVDPDHLPPVKNTRRKKKLEEGFDDILNRFKQKLALVP